MTRAAGVVGRRSPQALAAAEPGRERWSVAPLLESRPVAVALLLAGSAQTGLALVGARGWSCPVQEGLGLPCPGCGLSRAAAALLRGDLASAIELNPFVFAAIAFMLLLAVGAFGPVSLVQRLAAALRALEGHTGITVIVASAFLAYGFLRLLIHAVPFVGRALG